MKCQCCKRGQRTWTMQPFGPDDAITFALPGGHYRGFPAVACCDACKACVQAGGMVSFTYRGIPYVMSLGKVHASPF